MAMRCISRAEVIMERNKLIGQHAHKTSAAARRPLRVMKFLLANVVATDGNYDVCVAFSHSVSIIHLRRLISSYHYRIVIIQ